MKLCTYPNCDMPFLANGLCSGHWHQMRRNGILKPLRKRFPTMIDTLEHYSDRSGEHWLWLGFINPKGYGVVKTRGRNSTMLAHKAAYIEYIGPVPDGMEIDHVCRVRHCIRPHPEHIEAVTHAVNCQRGADARRLGL